MKLLVLMLMAFFIKAADTQPLQIPEHYKPYMELIDALYTTKGLTFEDAVRMVEPIADELGALRRDPQTPQLLFLIGQKEVFEEEHERLKLLLEANPENVCLKKARFLMWSKTRDYESFFFKRGDFTILNSGPEISCFFAIIPTPLTDIFPLHIHKLLFLMYISQFLGDISYIADDFYYDNGVLSHEKDDPRLFLDVFDEYLKKTMIPCGNKLFEHALWILREHVVYVGAKQEEEFA